MYTYLPFETGLKNCPTFDNRESLWETLLCSRSKDIKLLLEFGVFEGQSLKWFSEKFPTASIFGFDSFLGLPEDWNLGEKLVEKSTFWKKNDVHNILEALSRFENINVVQGMFEETLPKFVEQNKLNKVDLIHFDCDLYSSTKTIFTFLERYIKPGTLLLFDEFVSSKEEHFLITEHEYKAFAEFCKINKTFKFNFLGKTLPYVDKVGEQVVVEVVNV